ncbi:MAG TPA: chemotaxis response regulator protein-glutamate methylesterase [Blastocatellia bacterium]|nr:chemotaxis response regulator protein-glutamate methylesterase [Blastocatellia bacterium]
MGTETKKIRVLVVDDSAVMRRLISSLLERDKEIEVVATAIDGDFALSKADQLKPDVVTLDVDMPRMDGMTALSYLVSKHGAPVIMLSSLTSRGAELTMQALERGAVDFVCKPKVSTQVGEMGEELIGKIKAAARRRPVVMPTLRRFRVDMKWKAPGARVIRETQKIIAIGASSGGPHALRYLLPRIPGDIDASIVIVQHLPETFTAMLARWLDEICELEVKEAADGDALFPGRALIAPANWQMKVKRTDGAAHVVLESSGPVNGHMPSVDVLFKSVAKEYGRAAIAVLMTGMGNDGAAGLGDVKQSGGHTIAQDKESCSVYGMPRVAVERGFVEKVVSLEEMPSYIVSVAGQVNEEGQIHASSW